MRRIVFAIALLIFSTCPAIAEDMSTVAGVYISKSDVTQFLTLRADATFVLRQRKKPPDRDEPFAEFTGNYLVNGGTITLTLEDGGKAMGELKGNVFTDIQGEIWVKKDTTEHNVVRPKRQKLFQ
jgi:hypothetical protein